MVIALSLLVGVLRPDSARAHEEFKVLVFSKTAGFRHDSIPAGIAAIRMLGTNHHFAVDASENASVFSGTNLAQYQAVIFLSTTGDILDVNQQAAFEDYIQAGGGYVGIHSASDTEYTWPWYGGLVGAYFSGHPAGTPQATIEVADRVHPSTATLPKRWVRTDEWYNFSTNPRGAVHVLATLDETTYSGGTMGFDHPTAWCHEYDGGRAWYTGGGHTSASFYEPLFLEHLLGGIEFAAGVAPADAGATIDSNFQKVVLDASPSNPMELSVAPDGRVFYIERGGKLKIFQPQNSSIVVAGQLAVFSQLEDGLLGLALDPGFATNNWLYLFYSPSGATPKQQVSRFTMTGNTLNVVSEQVLLVIPTQREECCHSGGSLTFGPGGNLFVSLGDNTNPFGSDGYAPLDERPGRSTWDAQKSSANPNDLRGKILRIHPEINGTYTIPVGNLFPANGSAGRPEVYVMGNRNPFRIAVDSETGWLYWGEVGPDAGAANALRGPAGHDEWNQARSAGNYGWPYFIANNKPYVDYNFATSNSSGAFNPAAPVNNSPNNTGSASLPPARPAWIWYPYDSSPEFPEVNGSGGRTSMGGPIYHFQTNLISLRKLPAYYDDTVFIYEWSRNYIKEVKLDDNGDILKINPFLPSFAFSRPMDMEIGPDGAIYMIEWGAGFGGNNPDAKVIRIDYTGGNNRAPVAVAGVTPNNGAAPLLVQFSSAGSYDPDGPLTYQWSFFGNGVINSTNANPSFTYMSNGNYTAQLRVSDTVGNIGFASVGVTVGNHRPVVQINWPPNGGVFDWGKPLSFQGQVYDFEDGSTTNGTIACAALAWDLSVGHNDHSHGDSHADTCEGLFEAPGTHGGDGDNVFSVLRASYNDLGAASAGSLYGEAVHLLQPRRKEAENFTYQSGITNAVTADSGGGHDVTGIDHGDYISFFPVNFTNITALTFRMAATVSGGQIEVHLDSPTGILLGVAAVPNSAGSYTNVTVPVTDPAGTHELFLVFKRSPGATDLFVVNWMEFQGAGISLNQTSYGGTPHPIPGTFQAEDFDSGGEGVAYHDTDAPNNGNQYRAGGVDIENCSDTGNGYNIGWAAEGEWLEYTVNVATSGLYKFELRHAAYGGGVFHLESDGINKTGPLTNVTTGGWQNWQTFVRSNIALSAGQQVLRLALDKNGGGGFVANLNSLTFSLLAANNPPSVTITNPGNGAAFSAPGSTTLKATAADAGGSVSKVEFFANGELIGTDLSNPFSVAWTNVPTGSYALTARATDNIGLTTISAPVNISVVAGQSPFYGLPQTIPGVIQAEDFDGGGEGVAYHDSDTPNNGNQYRATFVDVENTGDAGGGYNVGFTAAGEWLKYTVNATVNGIYSIGARVGSQGNAGTFHIEIDGQNVTGTVTVNDTTGWQIYQTLTKTNISISAGQHEVRFVVDTIGGNGTAGNHNYFIFTATSTNPPPVFLQSAAGIGGVFADEAGAILNTAAKTLTIPKSANARFYRLRSTLTTHISNVQIIGTNVDHVPMNCFANLQVECSLSGKRRSDPGIKTRRALSPAMWAAMALLVVGIADAPAAAARLTYFVANDKIVISWNSHGRLETADQLAGPWTPATSVTPYTNSITGSAKFFRLNQTVDATTLHQKVLVGYQGWFRAACDGGTRWDHWNRDWFSTINSNMLTFEMWPDASDYPNKYPAPGFTHPGGTQAYLFSSQDKSTVDLHFDWMQEYGIDGAVVQRFVTQIPPDNVQTWKTNVLKHARAAANRTGRSFMIEYDMSGANTFALFSQLTNDWIHLVDDLKITQDPRYQHHDGKPALMIFGFCPERFSGTALPRQIIEWFKTNATYGVTLIGSGWWDWRASATGDWTNVYRSFHGYCPWNTGNYSVVGTNKYATTSYWAQDLVAATNAGMFYLPQVYPGFSWFNLNDGPFDQIPRLGGDFFWKQFHAVANLGVDMCFVGMFDEVDEGTAIFKVSNNPPVQGSFVTYDGWPADWYMRLANEGGKMLRHEIPLQSTIPISP